MRDRFSICVRYDISSNVGVSMFEAFFKIVMASRIFWTLDSGPKQAHPWEHEPCSLSSSTCYLVA